MRSLRGPILALFTALLGAQEVAPLPDGDGDGNRAVGVFEPGEDKHGLVGAVFGVGFFREYYTTHSQRRRQYVRMKSKRTVPRELSASDQEELRRRKLVRRSHATAIGAAWIITVPAAAGLAAGLYLLMSTVN